MGEALTDFLLARIAEDDLFWELAGEAKQAHPDRVRRYRAEAEAKRRIVERCAKDVASERMAIEVRGRRTLLDLAAIYADHPDYREEWRP